MPLWLEKEESNQQGRVQPENPQTCNILPSLTGDHVKFFEEAILNTPLHSSRSPPSSK